MRTAVAVFFGLVTSFAARAESIPAEDFGHESAYKDLALAPDGKAVAYAETIKGTHHIYLLDLATNKKIGLDLNGNETWPVHQSDFFWINNNRFLYSAPITGWYVAELPIPGRYISIKRDGHSPLSNIQGGRVLHLFRDEANGMVLMTGQDIAAAESRYVQFFIPNRPFVKEVNPSLASGIGRGVELDTMAANTGVRVVENPGNVVDWIVTPAGKVNAATAIQGTRHSVLYRDTSETAWGKLPGLGDSDPESYPLGFSADAATLYVGRITPAGTWGVYPYDLKKRALGEAILAHKMYDMVQPFYHSSSNGIRQQQLIFSPKVHALLGIRYATEYPRVLWLDPGLAELQQALDQALPNKINSFVSFSDDLQQIIILSWSDRDDGTYYFFDRSKQKLEKLLSRRSWIDANQLAEMRPLRFKARDGVLINGYLTVPPGAGHTDLPMIVFVHDLGWRTFWGFDYFTQFLANRGYAVLQIDPRGTAGYGDRFLKLDGRQGGRGAEADIIDATKWAVAQKIADPRRIGIVGYGSLGGYLVLGAVSQEPGLYQCAVDFAGITDPVKYLDFSRLMPDYLAFYTQQFGDPRVEAEAAILKDCSPLGHPERIQTPLLVIHEEEAPDWTTNQGKDLVAELQKAGKPAKFEHLKLEKFGHLMVAKFLNDVGAFTENYIPTGAPK